MAVTGTNIWAPPVVDMEDPEASKTMAKVCHDARILLKIVTVTHITFFLCTIGLVFCSTVLFRVWSVLNYEKCIFGLCFRLLCAQSQDLVVCC